jgi:hypothetical protein
MKICENFRLGPFSVHFPNLVATSAFGLAGLKTKLAACLKISLVVV